MIIYTITNNITGKKYVGQTIRSIEARINDHKYCYDNDIHTKLYDGMRKYGWDNFTFEIIDGAATVEDLNALETHYITLYDTVNTGYNMNYGGDNNTMFSPEVAKKHRARMQSEEVRSKISASMKRVRAEASEEKQARHNANVSEGLKRFYANGDKPNYKVPQHIKPHHRAALDKSHYKGVYCINEQGDIIAEFDSVVSGARWWYDRGYKVKHWKNHSNTIRYSAVNNKYIKGLKWIYRV